MVLRSIPLAICLMWLGYEAHFSPAFFADTVETSIVSITGGMQDLVAGGHPAEVHATLAQSGQ